MQSLSRSAIHGLTFSATLIFNLDSANCIHTKENEDEMKILTLFFLLYYFPDCMYFNQG